MARAFAIIALLAVLAGCDRPEVKEVRKAIPVMQERAKEIVSGEPLFALPSGPDFSPAGFQLILNFEVGGGRAYYEKELARVSWPGYQSGPTVGIGYDLGQTSATLIRKDWSPYLDKKTVERLASASGKTGKAGKAATAGLRDIVIPWDAALEVYKKTTIPRFWQLTNRTWPRSDSLEADGQWPLLSLIFNRGSSLVGKRRVEMKAIKPLVHQEDYRGIARQIRSMKRLWKGSDIERGMTRRRDAEARLIESCETGNAIPLTKREQPSGPRLGVFGESAGGEYAAGLSLSGEF